MLDNLRKFEKFRAVVDVCRGFFFFFKKNLIIEQKQGTTTLMVEEVSADDPKFVPVHDFIDL
jgi:hypothetical protein